jgi:hypothetical protein
VDVVCWNEESSFLPVQNERIKGTKKQKVGQAKRGRRENGTYTHSEEERARRRTACRQKANVLYPRLFEHAVLAATVLV